MCFEGPSDVGGAHKTQKTSRGLWILGIYIHTPQHPCIVYLPTFTIEINQM